MAKSSKMGRRKPRRNWQRDITVMRMVLQGQTLGQVGLKLGVTRERVRTMVQRTIESCHENSHYSTDPRWNYRSPYSIRREAKFWNLQLDKLEARYVVPEFVGVDEGSPDGDATVIATRDARGVFHVKHIEVTHG